MGKAIRGKGARRGKAGKVKTAGLPDVPFTKGKLKNSPTSGKAVHYHRYVGYPTSMATPPARVDQRLVDVQFPMPPVPVGALPPVGEVEKAHNIKYVRSIVLYSRVEGDAVEHVSMPIHRDGVTISEITAEYLGTTPIGLYLFHVTLVYGDTNEEDTISVTF